MRLDGSLVYVEVLWTCIVEEPPQTECGMSLGFRTNEGGSLARAPMSCRYEQRRNAKNDLMFRVHLDMRPLTKQLVAKFEEKLERLQLVAGTFGTEAEAQAAKQAVQNSLPASLVAKTAQARYPILTALC